MTSPRRCGVASTLLCTVTALVAAGCGGGTSTTSPSGQPSWPGALRLNIYNSNRGKVGDTTRTVAARGDLFYVNVAELGVSGVDQARVAVRAAHQGNRIGRLLGRGLNGIVGFRAWEESIDVFLFDTSRSSDYSCLDTGDGHMMEGFGERYTTLRQAAPGEALFESYAALGGPSGPFENAAAEFTRVLNPFGVSYGEVRFVGAAGGAMVGGWYDGPGTSGGSIGGMALLGRGTFWVATGNGEWTYELALHELAHAYVGAPDFYKQNCQTNLSTVLLDRGQSRRQLSVRGEDALRYWSLMATP